MTTPDKCAKCPAQLNAEQTIEVLDVQHHAEVEAYMGDYVERSAKREFLVGQYLPEDSDFAYDSLEVITESIRAGLERDMLDTEKEINDIRKEMGRFAANCDGPVQMSVKLADARILVATVCATREQKKTEALEPAEVERIEPYF